MLDIFYVANHIIDRGIVEKIPITPMKLQKLLYVLYREYLKLTGKPLFSERFEAWQYGPVVNAVYKEFKHFGSNSISSLYFEDGVAKTINEETDIDFHKSFLSIWERYKDVGAIELSERTHQKGSAWDESIKNGTYVLADDDIKKEVWV